MSTTQYRVHRFNTGLAVDQEALEREVNRLTGDVVAIVPNIMQFPFARINYLLIVERVSSWPAADAR